MIELVKDSAICEDGSVDEAWVPKYVTNSSQLGPAQFRKLNGASQSYAWHFVGFGVTGPSGLAFAGASYDFATTAIRDAQGQEVCEPARDYGYSFQPPYFSGDFEAIRISGQMQEYCYTQEGSLDSMTVFFAVVFGVLGLFAVICASVFAYSGIKNLQTRQARIPKDLVVADTDSLCWAFARMFFETEALHQDSPRGARFSRTGDWIQVATNFVQADTTILKDEGADSGSDPAIWEVFRDALNNDGELKELGKLIDPSVSKFIIETEGSLKTLKNIKPKLRNGRRLMRTVEELMEITAAELSPIVDLLMREVHYRKELAVNDKAQREQKSHTRRELAKIWR